MQKVLNPNYTKSELGNATHYALLLYFNNWEGGVSNNGEEGFTDGILDQELGPFKAGDHIIAFYNGESVTVIPYYGNNGIAMMLMIYLKVITICLQFLTPTLLG